MGVSVSCFALTIELLETGLKRSTSPLREDLRELVEIELGVSQG